MGILAKIPSVQADQLLLVQFFPVRIDKKLVAFFLPLYALGLMDDTLHLQKHVHKHVDRQRLSLGIIEKRPASSVDFREIAVLSSELVDFRAVDACITGVVSDHRECPVIIIRNYDSSDLSRNSRLIGIELQNLDIEIVEVSDIAVIARQ